MGGLEPTPAVAAAVFGAGLADAERYARLLGDAAVTRGLIGPREAARIWTRHLLNCAVIAEVIPEGVRVVDVGSGAGLPGLALACARADLHIDLVDSLHRRTQFLDECVLDLGLADRVDVVNGRIESPDVVERVGRAHWVSARAVAPLDRLARWCLPLLSPGGRLLAVKGSSAEREVAEHGTTLRRLGASSIEVVECGTAVGIDPTRVVVVAKR